MIYRFQEFELDSSSRVLVRRGQEVSLGQLPIDLLLYLIENRNRLVGKDELRRNVWGRRRTGASTIPTGVAALRRGLEDSSKESRFIRTVYGRGYRWIASVESFDGAATERNDGAKTCRGFFGRATELADLELLASQELGASSSALIVGDAGVGKTRLLEEFAVAARRRGCHVAIGRCSEIPGAPSFWPWQQILRAANCGDLQAIRFSISEMDTASTEGADAMRFAMFEAIGEGLSERARLAPLVVMLDDIHGADLPSILLYEALTGSIRPSGVRFVASLRRGELVDRGAEVADKVFGTPWMRQIELSGLAREEAGALAQSLAKFDVSDSLLDSLMEKSSGNPFFLDQLVRQLNDPPIQNERDVSERLVSIPPGIKTSTGACLRAVPPVVRTVLSAASVVGREFNTAILARTTGLDEADLLVALDQAVARGFVRRTGDISFAFSHLIVRDVLYEDLEPRERSRLHSATLSALRRIHGVLAGPVACEAARHSVGTLNRSDPGETLDLLSEAASWSEDNLGFEEAADYLESALGVLDRAGVRKPLVRADVLVRLAAAQRRSGRSSDAAETSRKASELARRCEDPELLARAALGYAPGFFAIEAGVVDEYLIAALEEALSASGRSDPGTRARLLGRLAIALYWSDRHGECRELADSALRESALSTDSSAAVFAATAREVACWGPDGAGRRARLAKAAVEIAEGTGDREMELVYRLFRLTGLLQIGDFARVNDEVAEFSKRAGASLSWSALWYRDLFGALAAMISGDWERAERLAASFEALGRRVNDRNAENCVVIHDLYRTLECGDPLEGLKLSIEQAKRFPRLKAYECARIYFAAAAGETEMATRRFRRLVGPSEVRLPQNAEWLVSMGLLSESCCMLNDHRRARVLFNELVPYEAEFLVVVFSVAVWRPVSLFMARLATTAGNFEEADRLFRRAARQAKQLNAMPWLADAHMGRAELLRRRAGRGDGKLARELALAAEGNARELGMTPLLRRARRFLWGPEATA